MRCRATKKENAGGRVTVASLPTGRSGGRAVLESKLEFARQIKAENDGLLLMSEDAADWVKAQKQVFATRPLVQAAPPTATWRLNLYYVVVSTKFEVSIMLIILLNMLQMACDWWEPRYSYPAYPDLSVLEDNAIYITTMKSVMRYLNWIFLV